MTFRKSILLLVSLCMIAALVACSSSSSTPPPPPVISVTMGAVPATVAVNSANATISATVANDSANGGVSWSCSPAPCGTFNPTSSASGADTTWTAPPVANATGITLTATSVTNSSESATSAAIPVTGNTLADGNYAYSLAGQDVNGNYYVAGVFTLAGGLVTTGEQDFVDFENPDNFDAINPTGSSVASSGDGNLTITLVTCLAADCTQTDTLVGVGGTEVLDGTVLPLSATLGARTLITEFDASATSSGELDLQDTTSGIIAATPNLGYAFALNGLDFNGDFLALGGVINVDGGAGSGTISGTGSIFDANDDEVTFPAETWAASSVSVTPDPFGRVTFTLNATDNVDFPQIVLNGYIVNSSVIRLVEGFDDSFGGTTGGTALSQGANTGLFGTTSVVAGNTYVFGLNGTDTANFIDQVAGQITPSATTAATAGFVDFNDLVTVEPASPDPVAGTYSVDPTGDVSLIAQTDGTNTYNVQLYLDGNGNALAITLDGNDVLSGYGFLQSAADVGLFTAANLNGPAGVDFTGTDAAETEELDAVGAVAADGVSAIAGTVDLNWYTVSGPIAGAPVTGTFTAQADGIFSDGLTGLDVTSCTLFTAAGAGCTSDIFNYYLTGDAAGDGFAIETDINQLSLGYFSQQ
jgi:hypothetical protein